MKKQVKKSKYTYVVDLVDAETPLDVKMSFIRAKATNGVKVSDDDIDFLILSGAIITTKIVNDMIEEYESKVIKIKDDKIFDDFQKLIKRATQPKKPWYKRFWGWIKNPFKKNK